MRIFAGFNNSTTRPALSTSTIGNYEIRGVGGGGGSTQADGADDGFLRLSAGGGSSSSVQSSIDLSGYSNVTDMNRNIVMRTSGTERLRINSDGYIGVGTSSPLAPLHVASSASQFVVAYGFLSPGGTGTGTYNQTISYSIQADGRIRSNEFNAISDIRIKKNIVPLKSNVQLLELNNLRVVNYSYIDQLANGNSIKTGFIAQEVEKVNDRFVNKSTEFIPSVFALVKSALVENEVLKIITEKPHGFVKGDVVKFFAEGKKEVIKTIDEVESANEFIVSSWKESTNNLFIYGKKITDFRAIDFDQITALSVGAIQELSKQIDSLKLENEKFKKKQSDFEARLLKLESKLN
jgi:hypothetical protein